MILIINSSSIESIGIALTKNNGEVIVQKRIEALYKQAEKLLPEIDNLLAKNKISLKDLKGVMVVSGPGGFTSLRVGVITANTLGYALKIPVVGIKLSEFDSFNELVKVGLNKLKKARVGELVIPFYGREPHITKPKKRLWL